MMQARPESLAERRTFAHRAGPRGLKLALSLAACAVLAAAVFLIVRTGRLTQISGGLQLRLAGFDWNYISSWNFWIPVAGAVLFLVYSTGLGWDRFARWPIFRWPASRMIMLAAVLFMIVENGLTRYLHVDMPEPLFLLLAFVPCGGAAFYLLRGRPCALERLGERLRVAPPRRWLLAAGLLGAAASLVGWRWYYGGYDELVDSISQNTQARLLLLGHFTLDIPQRLRDVINFPLGIASVPSYSQFPPGYLVFMIPLVAIGAPVNWLNVGVAAGIVAIAASIARRLGGRVAGLAAMLLLACSPFFIGTAGSAMNHAPACLALIGAAWCFLPAGPAPTRSQFIVRSLLGGLLLSWVATIRPLSALAHGLLWCGVWLTLLIEDLRRKRKGRPASSRADRSSAAVLRRIALASLAIVPPMLFLFFYDIHTTGHALEIAYEVSDPQLHRLGFTLSGAHRYTPFNALDNLASDFWDLNYIQLGWPIGSWLLIVPWWLRTRLARGERILIALVAAQAFAYALYSYHHLVLGPRFQFEAFPFIIILLALGIAPLLRRGGLGAGVLACLLLALSLSGPVNGYAKFGQSFEAGAARHQTLDRFMRRLLPIQRPTVVVFDAYFIDACGRYFPHAPGQPDLWFVQSKDEAKARQVPELAGCDWVYLNPSGAENN